MNKIELDTPFNYLFVKIKIVRNYEKKLHKMLYDDAKLQEALK